MIPVGDAIRRRAESPAGDRASFLVRAKREHALAQFEQASSRPDPYPNGGPETGRGRLPPSGGRPGVVGTLGDGLDAVQGDVRCGAPASRFPNRPADRVRQDAEAPGSLDLARLTRQ